MSKSSFSDILKQWEESQKEPKKDPNPVKVEKTEKSFAEIYDSWTKTHDDEKAMKKAKQGSGERKAEITINQIRKMDAQDELDLHEVKLEEAKVQVTDFLEQSYKKGYRKIRIVTGKGLHSKGGEAVLRPMVLSLVNSSCYVREAFTPKACEGGSGALVVILKGRK